MAAALFHGGRAPPRRVTALTPALPSAIVNPDRLELSLIKIRGIDVQREDVAGVRGARDAAVLRDRLDALAIDLEQHRAALDAAVERRAHRFDARDQDAADLLR